MRMFSHIFYIQTNYKHEDVTRAGWLLSYDKGKANVHWTIVMIGWKYFFQ